MSTWKQLKDNPRLKKHYIDRTVVLRSIREFFWSLGFLETDTPVAVKLPGQEPYLHPIPVDFHDPEGKFERFYLHTSPEFSLKKLLAAGFEKVFYITKCFRDREEFGTEFATHNTEFTMIEWYRAPGTLENIMDDTEELFKYVGKQLSVSELIYKKAQIPFTCNWDRWTMKETWQKFLGVNLDEYLAIDALKTLAVRLGYEVSPSDQYEDVFFKIFLNEIEPKLGFERPVFIYNYPKSMCSLSRVCASDNRYAERFELYVAGLELANAFGELTDASEQNRRLEEDKALRSKLGKPTWAVDPDFIGALESGMPNAGGIALGVDRMVVLFTGAHGLNEVIFETVAEQLEF